LSDTPKIEIIGEASNCLEIIEVVKTKKPDLVLIDIRMPELDGIDAAKIF
jgi:YesN/AraC family two-component response regulator